MTVKARSAIKWAAALVVGLVMAVTGQSMWAQTTDTVFLTQAIQINENANPPNNPPVWTNGNLEGAGKVFSATYTGSMETGTNGSLADYRDVMMFTLPSDIQPGDIITSVTMSMYYTGYAGAGQGIGGGYPDIGLYQVVNTPEFPYPQTKTGDVVVSYGSELSGNALGVPVGKEWETWASTPALVATVTDWLDTPADNQGLIVINSDETDSRTYRMFSTGGSSLAQFTPYLSITYESAPAVPEPGSLSLVGIGLLSFAAGLRKRFCGGQAV